MATEFQKCSSPQPETLGHDSRRRMTNCDSTSLAMRIAAALTLILRVHRLQRHRFAKADGRIKTTRCKQGAGRSTPKLLAERLRSGKIDSVGFKVPLAVLLHLHPHAYRNNISRERLFTEMQKVSSALYIADRYCRSVRGAARQDHP